MPRQLPAGPRGRSWLPVREPASRRPHPHVEIKIIDPWRGNEVPSGTTGELLLRNYFVMNGYLDMPDATRAAIDPDGWLHTGDLATRDERGYLRVTGRLKEMTAPAARSLATH